MSAMPRRRYAVLTEGYLLDRHAKTAHGVIRYARDEIVAVIDSGYAGDQLAKLLPQLRREAPIVGSLGEALAFQPDALLVGVAPAGGALPPPFRLQILAAIDAGLEIVSGLHELLADDAEMAARAKRSGARLWDVRVPPGAIALFSGAAARAPQTVILAVGSDCAIGKMSAMLELESAAGEAGDRAEFVPTGQTGMMIAGKGIAVDRVISDFVTGAAEQLILDVSPEMEFALVEGQGSIFHPAYAPVTLGLLYGSAPDALILCHQSGRTRIEEYGQPIPDLAQLANAHEALLEHVKPARCIAVALNTASLDDRAARDAIQRAQAATGLPADDVVRFGAAKLWDSIARAARKTDKSRSRTPARKIS